LEAADWAPDGQRLAVVRKVDNRIKRLEYPIGQALVDTGSSQCLDRPRVSPDGALVAFVECQKPSISIVVVDGTGRKRALWTGQRWVSGLAWSPKGDEVWFSAETQFRLPEARAVSLSGRERLLAQIPGAILDVSADGGVLMTTGRRGAGIRGVAPGETEERELSWLEGSAAADLSRDGRFVLFGEMMEGGGFSGRIYLRRTDGSPAVHLGDGYPLALSPDGTRAAVVLHGREGLTLLPTGAGEVRSLSLGDVRPYLAEWFPDGRRLLLGGMLPGREGRLYVLDPQDGSLRPLTAEMTGIGALSPRGRGRRAPAAARPRDRGVAGGLERGQPLGLPAPRGRAAHARAAPGRGHRPPGALEGARAARPRRRDLDGAAGAGPRAELRLHVPPAALGPLPRAGPEISRPGPLPLARGRW
jgi:dipeptidyl aminopeptidase/acylaminoacyl peptidase